MWDDDNMGGDIQDIFGETTQFMAPMPEINGDGGAAAIEIESELEPEIDANEEQPAIVAAEQNNIDDDEQRRYPRRTRRPVDRMGLSIFKVLHDKLLRLQYQCKNYECEYDSKFI